MFATVSEKIVRKLEQQHIVSTEQSSIYQYGINQALNTMLNVFTFLVIGLLFHMVVETVIFTAGYIPFRIYAGGFHAKTPCRCWLLSGCMLIVVLTLLFYVKQFYTVFHIISIVSAGVILWRMPVEDFNKPLDATEKRVYKKRGLIVFTIEAILVVLFQIFHMNQISNSLQMVWITLSIMLLLGMLKNTLIKNHN